MEDGPLDIYQKLKTRIDSPLASFGEVCYRGNHTGRHKSPKSIVDKCPYHNEAPVSSSIRLSASNEETFTLNSIQRRTLSNSSLGHVHASISE